MKALRTARPSVRTAAPAALVLGAAVLLSGCGDQQPGAAAVVDGRVISDTDAQQVAAQISTVPGVQQKVTPADTLVSLILAPYVLDQAEKDGKGISESQARAAVKEIKNPAPATLEFVRTSLAANGLSEQARAAVLAEVAKAEITVNPRYGTLDRKKLQLTPPAPNWIEAGRPLGHGDPAGPGHRGSAAVVAARLSLLLSTPRIAPGLLSREAWSTLERAGQVLGPGRRRAAAAGHRGRRGERHRPRRRAPRRAGPAPGRPGHRGGRRLGRLLRRQTPGSPTPSPPRSAAATTRPRSRCWWARTTCPGPACSTWSP